AHRRDRNHDEGQAKASVAARTHLDIARGLEDKPARTQQSIAEDEGKSGQEREWSQKVEGRAGEIATIDFKTLDEGAEHHALRDRSGGRSIAETVIPECPVDGIAVAEFESY